VAHSHTTDPRSHAGKVGAAAAREHERELLTRVAAADKAAFQEFYLLYHRRLARFLMRFVRRYDVAEEIINDTLWVVWRKAAEFKGASQVSTWVLGIAYRRALKTLQRAQPSTVVLTAAQNSSDVGTELSSEEPLLTEELHEWLGRALERLPLEQRLVLELTYYLGHSCEEVAAITNCPVSTVKTRMFHARRKMKVMLPQLSGEPRTRRETTPFTSDNEKS
jgi:RNA polymerase sigma-70 factor (ECF subfamily)